MRTVHDTHLVLIRKYSEYKVAQLLDDLDRLGILDKLVAARKIIVKPNLCAGTLHGPDSGVITNPRVLCLVLKAIRVVNRSACVLVVESDSTGLGIGSEKFAFQDYYKLVEEFPEVHVVDVSRPPLQVFEWNGCYFKRGIVLSTAFANTDFFISLAKIKTHFITVVSGALKNQLGCLPDPDKEKYHPHLESVIVDVNKFLEPDLGILEGCPAMEGAGPVLGHPRDLNLLMLSGDVVALDATMASMIGFDPARIGVIRQAARAGIGLGRMDQISVEGTAVQLPMCRFRYIPWDQQFYVRCGLAIQRLGLAMGEFGHRVHLVQSTSWLIRKVFQRVWRCRWNPFRTH